MSRNSLHKGFSMGPHRSQGHVIFQCRVIRETTFAAAKAAAASGRRAVRRATTRAACRAACGRYFSDQSPCVSLLVIFIARIAATLLPSVSKE